MPTVLDNRVKTARRPYRGWRWQCLWCYECIVAGERFTECVYVEDGIQVSRLHVECAAACDRQRRQPHEDQWDLPMDAQPRGMTESEFEKVKLPAQDREWLENTEDRSPHLAE